MDEPDGYRGPGAKAKAAERPAEEPVGVPRAYEI